MVPTNRPNENLHPLKKPRKHMNKEMYFRSAGTIQEEDTLEPVVQTRRAPTGCIGKALINEKLPAEVLSEIFLITKVTYLDDSNSMRPKPYSTWIQSTTHVCRHWRSIALSCPFLWTSRLPLKPQGMQAFLMRSGRLPISLDEPITTALRTRPWLPMLKSLVISSLERVKELRIELPPHIEEVSQISKALDVEMPHLEILHMKLGSISSTIIARAEELATYAAVPRPANLESVRELILHSCGFNWNRIQLRNLTTLRLKGHVLRGLTPSLRQILTTLKNSPELQTLELSYILSEDKQYEDVVSAGFSLPKLKFLVLSTGRDETKLAEILVNPTVLSKLEILEISSFINDESKIIKILRNAAQLVNHHTVSDITASEGIITFTGLRALTYTHNTKGNHYFNFTNLWDETYHIDFSLVVLLCMKEFRLHTLKKFECRAYQSLSKQWWRSTLERASVLEVLCTYNLVSPAGLISALTPDNVIEPIEPSQEGITSAHGSKNKTEKGHEKPPGANMAKGQPELSIFLPSLSRIDFMNAPFVPSDHHAQSTDGAPYKQRSLKHLAHCLQLRKGLGLEQSMLAIPVTTQEHRRSGAQLDKLVHTLVCMDCWEN